MAPLSKDSKDFASKVALGFKIAYERLVRQEALFGRSLVISRNGKPTQVPAAELLKELERNKKK